MDPRNFDDMVDIDDNGEGDRRVIRNIRLMPRVHVLRLDFTNVADDSDSDLMDTESDDDALAYPNIDDYDF